MGIARHDLANTGLHLTKARMVLVTVLNLAPRDRVVGCEAMSRGAASQKRTGGGPSQLKPCFVGRTTEPLATRCHPL